jgi:hypothetical protein
MPQTHHPPAFLVFVERRGGDVSEMKELGAYENSEAAEAAAVAFLSAASPPPEVDAAGNLSAWVAEVYRGTFVDELGFPLTRAEAERRGDVEWESEELDKLLLQPQPPSVVAELARREGEIQREQYRQITGHKPADRA